MNKLSTFLAAALQSLCILAATVPVEWTETPRDRSPRQFTARHGETLRIRCTLAGFDGAIEGEPRLYFQTNGMGRLWWDAPAAAASNRIEAVFGASEDVGADRVSLCLGSPSNAYASAVLRLLPSPGFTPASLSPPMLSIDFATLEWSNAPWATTNALAAKQDALPYPTNAIPHAAIIDAPAPADYSTSNAALVATIEATAPAPGNYATVSNRAVNARGRLDLAVYGQEDAYIVEFFDLDDESQSFPALLGKMTRIDDIFYRIDGVEGYSFADDGFEMTFAVAGGGYAQWRQSRPRPDDLVLECTIGRRRYVISRPPTSPTGDTLAKASELATAVSNVVDKPYVESLGIESGVQSLEPATNYTDEAIGVFARTNKLYATAGSLEAVGGRVSAIETWAVGDDVTIGVADAATTNATLDISHTNKVMYSSAAEHTNTLNAAKRYADGRDAEVVAAFDAALNTLAWGRTTSSGAPSPDDTLMVEKRKVAITGGGNFSRIETSTGAYFVMAVSLGSTWTLESLADAQNPDNPSTITLLDANGNAVHTVTSTASREVYAVYGEQHISVSNSDGNDVITIEYPVVADSAPTLLFSPDVKGGIVEYLPWDSWPTNISSVVSSGRSGFWTNTVTMVGAPGAGFFRAKYTKVGSTTTTYDQPLGVSQLVVRGTNYNVSVETVNGRKLMVLTEAP